MDNYLTRWLRRAWLTPVPAIVAPGYVRSDDGRGVRYLCAGRDRTCRQLLGRVLITPRADGPPAEQGGRAGTAGADLVSWAIWGGE
jgi:hypothetical protein